MHKAERYFMLIVTTTSIYRIPMQIPAVAGRSLLNDKDSALMMLTSQIITSPTNSYNFTNDIGPSLPTVVSAVHSAVNNCSLIGIATSTSLHVCSVGFGGDKLEPKFGKLEAHGKSIFSFFGNAGDVVTMCFTTAVPKNTPLLFTIFRDGTLRVWLHTASGTVLLATEKLYKYIDGAKPEFHSCVSRGSRTLLGLFVSFNSISQFVVLKPKVTPGPEPGVIASFSLQTVCTIAAPKSNMMDFKVSEHSLWSLWCNADFEMQVLNYELGAQDENLGVKGWNEVATLRTSDDNLPAVDGAKDLREFYRKRIFKSGIFPAAVIKKTLMMLKQNETGVKRSSAIGSMLRLEREVIDCIGQQLRKQQASTESNGPWAPEDLIAISNQLWEKFHCYCEQYNEESARPIGLFLGEEMIESALHVTVGVVRKHFVSFIRTCDRLETAYYGAGPSPAPDELGTFMLVKFLKEIEETLTQDQKQELDGFLHQRQVAAKEPTMKSDRSSASERFEFEDNGVPEEETEEISFNEIELLSAAQYNSMTSCVIDQFGAKKLEIDEAVDNLLRSLTPDNQPALLLNEAELEKANGGVSVYTGPHFYGELAVATAKQTVSFRYKLLRNLLLLQQLIRKSEGVNRSDKLNRFLAVVQPRIVMLVRCYYAMNWLANKRLEMDWSRKRNEIVNTFPTNQQHTPFTLLQAYARCRANYKRPEQWISQEAADDPLDDPNNSYLLSLTQKASALIAYISPMTDDFRFAEWLSENELSLHIDDYVELVDEWCTKNKYSRALIKAKSFLLDGEPYKAYDLFLKARQGIYEERYLLKFASGHSADDQRSAALYQMPSMYFLQAIRLFDLHGAYDMLPKLVNVALQETLFPEQQVRVKAMFQNIAFSSYMAMGRYKLAYMVLWKNVDPRRKKDCLRQVVGLLLSQRNLDLLAVLPTRGQLAQFLEVVTMCARSADMEEGFRYDFLYSFLVGEQFYREAAKVALEGAKRYETERVTHNSLEGQYQMLLKSAVALANLPAERAWLPSPTVINPLEQSAPTERNVEVLRVKHLEERMIIMQSVHDLSKAHSEQLALLEPKELVVMLMRKRMYNRALELAHCCVPAKVPVIYKHITKACIFASSSGEYTSPNDADDESSDNERNMSWLHANFQTDVRIGGDTATTAWNYLRHMIEREPDELIEEAHLAVLESVLAEKFHVPAWVRAWCFEHTPVQLVRAYWRNRYLLDACQCMIQLFEKRLFVPPSDVAFPLTLVDQLFFELERSPNRSEALLEEYRTKLEAMFDSMQ
ncbi:AGAP004671-PA-like protein [Anopheles sinensis]|uniref:AGAP004671-PA-like protein n=1 Tax=Anopheles sinensis TaxID=74873 RepID=A0A084WF28_ANOSI|nr:AGAP004671-PA-like protein [Anopheles sinensis]